MVSTRALLSLLIALVSATRLASGVAETAHSAGTRQCRMRVGTADEVLERSSRRLESAQLHVRGKPLLLRGGAPNKPTVCKFEFEIDHMQDHETVAVVGSVDQLGGWEVSKAIPLLRVNHGNPSVWAISLVLPRDSLISYKYIIKREIKWEELDLNRALIPPRSSGPVTVRELYNSPSPRMLDMGMGTKAVRHGWCRFTVKVEGLHGKDYVAVIGSHPMLGAWDVEEAIPLKMVNNGDMTLWTGDAELAGGEPSDYKYVILKANEWEPLDGDRSFYTALDGKLTTVHDQFGVAASRDLTPPSGLPRRGAAALCNFQLKLPGLSESDGVAIVGNQDWLGSWSVQRAVPMDRVNPDTFSVTVHLPAAELIKYKYVILHEPRWEGLNIHRSVAVAAGGLTLTTDAFDQPFHPMGVRCPPLLSSSPSASGGGGMTSVRFELTSKFLGADDNVGILGNHELLGAWNEDGARPLEREGGDSHGGETRWVTHVDLPVGMQIDYKYVVLPSVRWEPLECNREITTASATFAPMRQRDRSGVLTPASNNHAFTPASPVRPPSGKRSTSPPSFEDFDHSQPSSHTPPPSAPPSPFAAGAGAAMEHGRKRCSFRVEVVGKLGRSDRVLVCGSDAALGNWEVPKSMHLLPSPSDANVWVGSAVLQTAKVAYKYLLERRGGQEGGQTEWERRGDRHMDADDAGEEGVLTVSDVLESPLPEPAEDEGGQGGGGEHQGHGNHHGGQHGGQANEREWREVHHHPAARAAPGTVVRVPGHGGEESGPDEGLVDGEFAWVEEVMAGSPAEEAGLKAGDRLLEVGSVTAHQVDERGLSAVNEEVLRAGEQGSALMVKIVRMEDLGRGHEGWRVVRLTPKRWGGEGLIGCRLARSE